MSNNVNLHTADVIVLHVLATFGQMISRSLKIKICN